MKYALRADQLEHHSNPETTMENGSIITRHATCCRRRSYPRAGDGPESACKLLPQGGDSHVRKELEGWASAR